MIHKWERPFNRESRSEALLRTLRYSSEYERKNKMQNNSEDEYESISGSD